MPALGQLTIVLGNPHETDELGCARTSAESITAAGFRSGPEGKHPLSARPRAGSARRFASLLKHLANVGPARTSVEVGAAVRGTGTIGFGFPKMSSLRLRIVALLLGLATVLPGTAFARVHFF